MGDFTMPSLGADMESGTLLEWRVAVGDHVDRGDIVAVIDTEKSTVEIEVFESGIVEALLVEPGTEVDVGTPLARIGSGSGTEPPAAEARAEPEVRTEPAAPVPPEEHAAPHSHLTSPLVRHLAEDLHVDPAGIEGTGVGHRVTRDDVRRAAGATASSGAHGASPLARRRAAELGVDLAGITGSGPGGAVVARDVGESAPPAPVGPAASTPSPKTGADRARSVRSAIARLMAQSNREIPHYHLTTTIDLLAMTKWLAATNAERPAADRILPAALFIRATALALVRSPELNGYWTDDEFRPGDGIHVAFAVSLRSGGIITPVVRDADRRSLDETMRTLADLVTRARSGSLRSSDLTGATVTITSLGDRGAEAVFGVIHPPQVALVGFGRIVERPWAVDGMVGVHPVVTATLSGDHRATDAMSGSRMLERLDGLLQKPADL
ncbi:MAG: dihydrolipoamide acetyltransferase family protein [Acidimicrobiales bacterium]